MTELVKMEVEQAQLDTIVEAYGSHFGAETPEEALAVFHKEVYNRIKSDVLSFEMQRLAKRDESARQLEIQALEAHLEGPNNTSEEPQDVPAE